MKCWVPTLAQQKQGRKKKKKKEGLGVVSHTCNPNHSGGKARRMVILGQPREKN
jgi:hypothetical protein